MTQITQHSLGSYFGAALHLKGLKLLVLILFMGREIFIPVSVIKNLIITKINVGRGEFLPDYQLGCWRT